MGLVSITLKGVDTNLSSCIIHTSTTQQENQMKTQEEIFAICSAKEDSGLFRLSSKDGQLFECYSIFGDVKWAPQGYYTPSRFHRPTFGPLPDGHTPVSFAAGRYL